MNPLRHGLVLLFTAAVGAAPAAVRAQPTVTIDASKGPSCSSCTIELTKIASLGRPSDEEIPTWYSSLTIDSRGRYFLTGADKKRILVYDSAGRYLRQLGRGGQGPGEFTQAISLAVGPGDSLFVIDGRRVTVFAPSLAFARTGSLPDVSSARFIPLSTGALVIPVLTGFSQHYLRLVGPAGDAVRTYGSRDSALAATCRTCFMRTVAPGRSADRFWSTIASRHELEEMNIAGALLRRVVIQRSPWFESWTVDPAPGLRPRTMLRGAWEDANGRLWTFGVSPERNWAPPPPRSPPTSPRGATAGQRPDTALMRQSATVVDVLDLRTGRVIATRRFQGRALHFVAPNRLYEYREDDDGFVIIDIWNLSLREP